MTTKRFEFSVERIGRQDAQALMTSLVVPRPVAWVSTASGLPAGRYNLAPFSSLSLVCDKPPLVAFSCGRRADGERKDTALNIIATREFVLNFVDAALLDKIALSAAESAADVDEFALTGMTPQPGHAVKAPIVSNSITSLECRLHRIIKLGDDDARVDLIIGRIVHVHTRDGSAGKSNRDGSRFKSPGALGIDWYVVGGKLKRVAEPSLR